MSQITPYAHYTVRARPGRIPLLAPARAQWLWERLREAFPLALAVILMPDHVHFIAPWLERGRRRLAAIVGAFARVFGLGELWEKVPAPQILLTLDKVARGCRYVWLNCCRPWSRRRIQLVDDPLLWPWSTLRDVVGAVIDPWIDAGRLATALQWNESEPAASLHAYAAGDPHVCFAARSFPEIAPATTMASSPLDLVAEAALASARSIENVLTRRSPARTTFVGLATRQGWRSVPGALAEVCDVTTRSVARLAQACPPAWAEAAALCLGDPRLRSMETPLAALDAVATGRW